LGGRHTVDMECAELSDFASCSPAVVASTARFAIVQRAGAAALAPADAVRNARRKTRLVAWLPVGAAFDARFARVRLGDAGTALVAAVDATREAAAAIGVGLA